MNTLRNHRFIRFVFLSVISSVCLLSAQSASADRYYKRNPHYSCPPGYRLIFIPAHWQHGYYIPARYVCTPVRYKQHYRHHRQDHYRRGYNSGYYYRSW